MQMKILLLLMEILCSLAIGTDSFLYTKAQNEHRAAIQCMGILKHIRAIHCNSRYSKLPFCKEIFNSANTASILFLHSTCFFHSHSTVLYHTLCGGLVVGSTYQTQRLHTTPILVSRFLLLTSSWAHICVVD